MAVSLEKIKLVGSIISREDKLLSLCKDKKVLHLGCADFPFYRERYKAGNLLHEKLHNVSKKVTGIDINQLGIEFLKSIGYENLLEGNVEEFNKLNLKESFDVIIAGELLEHLSNTGKFFEKISLAMHKDSILIITVPNAHSIKSFIRVISGNELIHPDHVYYFSPATIGHICKRYNYVLLEYFYYLSEPNGIIKKIIFSPMKYLIKFISPFIADGLICIIRKGQ